ncbi:MAG: DEAD/DEAH box helicase [Spirochaetales bacterium]|nr:DEAD/DEAH box helicase [Spirochaetales bacterium]
MINIDQELAYKKFSRLKCGALFMAMGTGKTKVALTLAQSKYAQEKVDFVLYIAPASAISSGNLEAEKQKWTPELPVTFATCEGFGASDRIYLEILSKVKKTKTFCICDESLYIKNIEAKRTRRIIEIGSFSMYRLILNGTPVTKNILDVWTQMEFLSPKIFDMSFREFKYMFCVYSRNAKKARKKKIVRYINVSYLISLISPYVYQADLDLEVKKKYADRCYYVDKWKYNNYKNKIFDKYYDSYEEELQFYAFAQVLQRWYTSQPEHREAVQDCINEINDTIIVFVKYVNNIPENAIKITGATKNREEIIDRFRRGEFKVLYMTYGCGSFSLNLQFCKNIIFADHDWDYSRRVQAEGRIYRLGSGEDVMYYDIVCENSGLEKLIQDCLKGKKSLLAMVKKEITKLDSKDKAKKFIEKL